MPRIADTAGHCTRPSSEDDPVTPQARAARLAGRGSGGWMGEHKEVRYEQLYVKVPGTDRLRRGAAGRLRHLLNTGWRETERVTSGDYVRVRMERTGHA